MKDVSHVRPVRALIPRSLHELKVRDMTEEVLGVEADDLIGALSRYQSVAVSALNNDALHLQLI